MPHNPTRVPPQFTMTYIPDWENSTRVRFYLHDLIDTFERGSGVRTTSVSTADLICNDEFNEANEEFILLLEIMNTGSDDVQLESEGMKYLLYVLFLNTQVCVE